jgi:hypothetical protein
MDSVTIIRIVSGCLFLAVLATGIAYVAFLSGVLSKCSPTSRTMQPGMVWLLIIPFVHIIWNFFVISALARSLRNEFNLRNIQVADAEPGKSVGIAMAICGACNMVPFVNFVTILPSIILWIVYWVKIAGYARHLDLRPVQIGALN